jgi:CRP-like cAMP-binding protein/Fe-S-cluster-containing dehydrogenase component
MPELTLQSDAAGKENLEFDNFLGDLMVELGGTYEAILKRYPKGKTLAIDGFAVTVPVLKTGFSPNDMAAPAMLTTLMDAVRMLYQTNAAAREFYQQKFPERSAKLKLAISADDPERIEWDYFPVPALCHKEDMRPVYVCRVCMVETTFRGKKNMFPACFFPVTACDDNAEVNTIATSDRAKRSAKTVTELLLADYKTPQFAGISEDSSSQELLRVAEQLGAKAQRFPAGALERRRDESSSIIAVDLNACILCDRCVRACSEIKNNQVIGRMGKGYGAQIAFDLNFKMEDSSCVACGECMVSCPTGALTRRGQINPQVRPAAEPLTGKQLREEIRHKNLFYDISETFLDWNRGAVIRRQVKRGEVLCAQGEFGRTAFIIEQGRFKIFLDKPAQQAASPGGGGLLGFLGALWPSSNPKLSQASTAEPRNRDRSIPIDAPVNLTLKNPVGELGPEHIMFGEMACLNHQPRSATVVAMEDGVVLEMLRNVIYMMQRSPKAREILDRRYRETMLGNLLKNLPFYAPGIEEELKDAIELRRYSPGTTIFREGDAANSFYIVLCGHVKLTKLHPTGEQVLKYLSKGNYFGEMGLVADWPDFANVSRAELPGTRTASAAALDHVDLARIKKGVFLDLAQRYPDFRDQIVKAVESHLKENAKWRTAVSENHSRVKNFMDQGLVIGQKLLVLDLEKCTRCDECTRACADAHAREDGGIGVSRLTREGLRFDKFLVASACRSCMDPYCLVGCPVGSIGRSVGGQIQIESWCIGCGKCAENCPYGNINIQSLPRYNPDTKTQEIKLKAVTCDLCTSLSNGVENYIPACVYACPHDAAHRKSGPELLQIVELARQQ